MVQVKTQVQKVKKVQTLTLISWFMIGLVVTACSSAVQPETEATTSEGTDSEITNTSISIDGSSTVYPISEAIAQEFQQANPDADISVEFSGTGGGFAKFCAGEIPISGASRPISTDEMAVCREAGIRFIELPVAFDALTIVVHPENDWAEEITVAELQQIWDASAEGQIQTWQQVRPSYPDRPLTLYGPGTDSGTYDYFAEVITSTGDTRSDYTASEDDDVLVEGVASDPDALGYFGFSYYEQNRDRVQALPVDGGNGPVIPSRETVEDASYQPLSRPLFIYVNARAAQDNPDVRNFVDFYLDNAAQVATSVGYVPLPEEAYQIGHVHLYNGDVGTAYSGRPEPNLTIGEVLRREQTF
jgi:phosphate transport system substrate-binding protein